MAFLLAGYLFNCFGSTCDQLDISCLFSTSLSSVSLLSVGSTNSDHPLSAPDPSDDQEEDLTADNLVYYIINMESRLLVRTFSSRSALIRNAHNLFGLSLGPRKIVNIIYNNDGILHCPNGSFIISVAGVYTHYSRDDANF